MNKYAIMNKIMAIKHKLAKWDYKTSKYLDGEYTTEEWNAIKAQRKLWRAEINALELELQKLESNA